MARRTNAEVLETWEGLWDLAWYARHMIGANGNPEADHPGIEKQREVEAKFPVLCAEKFWRDPVALARIDGMRAALAWSLDAKGHDEELDPSGGSETGLYDT